MPVPDVNDPHPLLAQLAEALPVLDEHLAAAGVPLERRPLQAAIDFVRFFILELEDPAGKRPPPRPPDLLNERWFAFLHRDVGEWFERRYGSAADRSFKKTATGFVVLWHTAFRIEVPLSLSEPGKPGKTVWLSFPDSVLDEEDPIAWLTDPPGISHFTENERVSLAESIREVATLLRSINSSLLGIGRISAAANGLLHTSRTHLHRAADNIVLDTQPKIDGACWDIQMACECALKAVLDRHPGEFKRIHDLQKLYKAAAPFASEIQESWVKMLPNHKRMLDLRYGIVQSPSTAEFLDLYLAALRIVDAAVKRLVKFGLGKAGFEIRRAPWLVLK